MIIVRGRLAFREAAAPLSDAPMQLASVVIVFFPSGAVSGFPDLCAAASAFCALSSASLLFRLP